MLVHEKEKDKLQVTTTPMLAIRLVTDALERPCVQAVLGPDNPLESLDVRIRVSSHSVWTRVCIEGRTFDGSIVEAGYDVNHLEKVQFPCHISLVTHRFPDKDDPLEVLSNEFRFHISGDEKQFELT